MDCPDRNLSRVPIKALSMIEDVGKLYEYSCV